MKPIVIYGATGYTGRLVAEYFFKQYGVGGSVAWAMAGRSLDKLAQVRDEIGLPAEVPLIAADAGDPDSLRAMVEGAGVIITTVGPYQLYGRDLVALCAETGTDYVDLCGEPTFMHEMIEKHGQSARNSGARVIFSCGFDSIPFDLGVYFLQKAMLDSYGKPAQRVRGRVESLVGSWSGGTLASARATMAAAGKDQDLIKVLVDPFSLTEGFQGPSQPDGNQPKFDDAIGSWVAPFMMAVINTKNIHRSNALLDHLYGTDFEYDEMLTTGPGDEGEAVAKAVAADDSMATDTTAPGEGPSEAERIAGSYDLLFVGHTAAGDSLSARVKGDMDPGYGSTSKMIAESAICLAENPELAGGGIWTPAPALGEVLIERLCRNAGLSFEIT